MKAIIFLIVTVLSGCVSLPKDRGAPQVQTLLGERSGSAVDVRWKYDSATCAEAAKFHGDNPLTADRAVIVALSCSPRMRAIYSGLASTQAEVEEATQLLNPRLDFARLSTGMPTNLVQTTWSVSLRFVELILLPARKRMGKQQLLISQQYAAQAVLELERDVRAGYIAYAAARSIAEMLQKVATTAALSARTAEEFHAAGNISELQLSRERAAAIEAEMELSRAQGAVFKSRAELLTLMGLAVTGNTAASLTIVAELPLPHSLRDDPELLLKAAERRLDIRAARERYAAASTNRRNDARPRWLDGLEVSYETERETGTPSKSGPGISLPLPIFGRQKNLILRAQANAEAAESELAALEISLANDAWSALSRSTAAHSTTSALRDRLVPLRARITELTQREFNFMFVGTFELLAVKREEFNAYRLYIEAVRDEWLAQFEVQRVAGGALPPALLMSDVEGARP